MVTEYVEGQTLRERLDRGACRFPSSWRWRSRLRAPWSGSRGGRVAPRYQAGKRDGAARRLCKGARLRTRQARHAGREHHGRTTETAVGVIMGTPRYMSPEQARGERVTFQSDQFSFGVLLYELATGRPPFQRTSAIEAAAAVITAPGGAAGQRVSTHAALRSVASSSDAWQRTLTDGTRRRAISIGIS